MKRQIYYYYRKYILKIAHQKYLHIRTRKYSLEYYLDKFTLILNDYVTWKSLKNKTDAFKFHWKTIYNEFNKWSKDNIFEEAFNNFINDKYFKISKVKKDKKINLFIDATKIVNKLGSEGISIDCENKKKNVTSLTVICDQNKLPLSVRPIDINRKIYNNRSTSKHEINNVQKTLDKINLKSNLKDYIAVNLTGDKAYITQKKYKFNNRELKMTTPKRKNQKIKNTPKEKELLKDRHNIENVFAYIKKNNRTMVRKDKKLHNYLSFIYMTMIENHISFALNNNSERYL